MASGELTSHELTKAYLKRIRELNPLLHAVIEADHGVIGVAARLDAERRHGRVRGPLHGIPIVVKDNIATAGRMETTAGSLALVGSRVPGDAPLVARLRSAGAVILGKANLSEWANFRGFAPFNGWSARGGFTRDPYLLDNDPCGSSSGSAVAPAAEICAAAVGTETDGSIVCPSGNNHGVGIKPTLGLISQDGIIPIAHSQDTAGPMTRTVTDAAILLGAMQTPFGPVSGRSLPTDYTVFLRRGALRGARIGADRRYFTPDFGGEPDLVAVAESALETMRELGATIIDTDTGDSFSYFDAEFTVLLTEFKVDIAKYLSTLSHTRMRTLADLIAFNQANCTREMKYFGQELFEMAEVTNGLDDPDYLAAREFCLQMSRAEGIDGAIARDDLDAIVAPSYSFGSTPAAVAGYPDIAVPVAISAEGRPAGVWMYGGFLQEPRLLALAYDLEQEIAPRARPQFVGDVPDEPPDAGICAASSASSKRVAAAARTNGHRRHLGTGKEH
jgi:amidase